MGDEDNNMIHMNGGMYPTMTIEGAGFPQQLGYYWNGVVWPE